jgi:dTDP-glucose pyrophosphorylase
MLPVGRDADGGERLACDDALASLARAGVDRALIVTRREKRDLRAAIGERRREVAIDWLEVAPTRGVPWTLAAASSWRPEAAAILALPDLLVRPLDLAARLVARHGAGPAAVALLLVPGARPEAADLVAADADGRVRRMFVKDPAAPPGLPTWVFALLSPAFRRHLAAWTAAFDGVAAARLGREAHFGDAIQDAIAAGLVVESTLATDGRVLDIGTPAALAGAAGFR